MTNRAKKLSVLSLVMINLAALGGIRTWAPMAESGFNAAFFLIFGVLTFFIPLSLVTAELATAWPHSGGVYAWVRQAFGHRWGYLAIWLLWIQNVLWFPTMLSFLASSITFLFDPGLSQSGPLNFGLALLLFWGATWMNMRGTKASSVLSAFGAVCGTFIPSLLLIGLGAWWLTRRSVLEMNGALNSFIPDLSSFEQLALLAGVIISLLGIEMSAVHAAEIQNPQKNYPKAILFSSIVLILFSLFGVLTIAMVIPPETLLLNAGCLQAFAFFFDALQLQSLTPLIALIVTVGGLGSLATWIMGPAKGLIAAAEQEDLSLSLRKVNRNGIPQNFLILQSVVVSLLSIAFLFLPTVNTAYWIFLVLTTQLYLLMYLLLFGAVLKLRKTQPHVHRPFKIPGGRWGLWIFCTLGFLSSIFALAIAFFPPAYIEEGRKQLYVVMLVGAMGLMSCLPLVIARMRRKRLAQPSLPT